MLEIPSVQRENVEDGDGAQVVHGRLFLRVPERRSAENGESNQIEGSANDNKEQRVVSSDQR